MKEPAKAERFSTNNRRLTQGVARRLALPGLSSFGLPALFHQRCATTAVAQSKMLFFALRRKKTIGESAGRERYNEFRPLTLL